MKSQLKCLRLGRRTVAPSVAEMKRYVHMFVNHLKTMGVFDFLLSPLLWRTGSVI